MFTFVLVLLFVLLTLRERSLPVLVGDVAGHGYGEALLEVLHF
jgi:hypothetical protein